MTSYTDIDDGKAKHLEMIQAIVSRLGGNGFLVKGWAITIVAAFLGLAVQLHSWKLAAIAGLPTVAFWLLDGYFLRAERLFRALYDEVRKGTHDADPFSMDVGGIAGGLQSLPRTLVRPALLIFYLGTLIVCGGTAAIV